MNPTRKTATNWLSAIGYRLILGVLVSSLSFNLVAQTVGDPNKFSTTPGNSACQFFDGFLDNKDGTVTDPRNGLIWKRCAEGMAWNASGCSGQNAKQLDWFEAMKIAKSSRFLGKSDWRLPNKEELVDVIGNSADCKANKFPKDLSASNDIAWPVRDDGYPGMMHSYSPHLGNGVNGAWIGSFYNGEVADNGWTSGSYKVSARLVRSRNSIALSQFNQEYSKLASYKDQQTREVAQSKQEQANREAQERRDQAARDEQYRRDAPARQARQMCEAQKQTCRAHCPPFTDSDWKRASGTQASCMYQCNSISCN